MLKSRKTILGAMVALVAMAIVAIIAVVNLTATATVSAAPAEQAKPTVTIPPGAQAKVDEYNQLLGTFRKSFADKLGVDEAKLDQAFGGAVSDTVDKLLKDGKISQQQANSIKALTKDGFKGFSFPPQSDVIAQLQNSMPFSMDQLKQFEQKVASTLNIQPSDLEAQLMAGKSLSDIATAQKVDLQTLKTAISDYAKTLLDDAVKAGKLTQAQADQFSKFAPMLLDKLVTTHFKG